MVAIDHPIPPYLRRLLPIEAVPAHQHHRTAPPIHLPSEREPATTPILLSTANPLHHLLPQQLTNLGISIRTGHCTAAVRHMSLLVPV